MVTWEQEVPPAKDVDKGPEGRGQRAALGPEDPSVQPGSASSPSMPTETPVQAPPRLRHWPPAQTHRPSPHEGKGNSPTPRGQTLRGSFSGQCRRPQEHSCTSTRVEAGISLLGPQSPPSRPPTELTQTGQSSGPIPPACPDVPMNKR